MECALATPITAKNAAAPHELREKGHTEFPSQMQDIKHKLSPRF
jgi:hypothetical protein